jgi:hypothetical protein
MKKLNKLQINSDKLIKNDDLIALRGGYDGSHCCFCRDSIGNDLGTMAGATPSDCSSLCAEAFFGAHGVWNCII